MGKKILIWGIECCGTAEKFENRREEVLAEGCEVIDFEGGFYRVRETENTIYLKAFSTTDKSFQKALGIIDELVLKCGDLDCRLPNRRQKTDGNTYDPTCFYSREELQEIRDMGGVGERRWF